jgi:hypothetical protein
VNAYQIEASIFRPNGHGIPFDVVDHHAFVVAARTADAAARAGVRVARRIANDSRARMRAKGFDPRRIKRVEVTKVVHFGRLES